MGENEAAPASPSVDSVTSPARPRLRIATALPVATRTTRVIATVATATATTTCRTRGPSAGSVPSRVAPAIAHRPIADGTPSTAAIASATTPNTAPKIARSQPSTSGGSARSRATIPRPSMTMAAMNSISSAVREPFTSARRWRTVHGRVSGVVAGAAGTGSTGSALIRGSCPSPRRYAMPRTSRTVPPPRPRSAPARGVGSPEW